VERNKLKTKFVIDIFLGYNSNPKGWRI
jgi:hypothetical protein